MLYMSKHKFNHNKKCIAINYYIHENSNNRNCLDEIIIKENTLLLKIYHESEWIVRRHLLSTNVLNMYNEDW